MTREEVFQWVQDEYGTEPEYPWKDSNAVLRRAACIAWRYSGRRSTEKYHEKMNDRRRLRKAVGIEE